MQVRYALGVNEKTVLLTIFDVLGRSIDDVDSNSLHGAVETVLNRESRTPKLPEGACGYRPFYPRTCPEPAIPGKHR